MARFGIPSHPAPSLLFAADRQTFAPLGAAPLEDQTTVFRAHSHKKTMGPFAVTRIGLERTLSLHEIPSGAK